MLRQEKSLPSEAPEAPFPVRADLNDFEAWVQWASKGFTGPSYDGLADWLRAVPGRTVRDWKGKGPSQPWPANDWDTPWHKLKPNEYREQAVRHLARELPQNVRQAAAHDPMLVWNDYGRKYRWRLPSDPPAEGANQSRGRDDSEPAAVHK